jgi:hypothetical protein
MTFVLAAFNFATVRQLRLLDRWVKQMLLRVFRPSWRALDGGEKGCGAVSGQGFVFVGGKDEAGFVNQIQEDDGKSFAVFSPLCNKVPVVDEQTFQGLRAPLHFGSTSPWLCI